MGQIQLVPPTAEQINRFAIWRTDIYICTSIAFAKSLGKTPGEFTTFLGYTHDWEKMRGQGLEPPLQLLHFLIKNYPNGEFEILSESDWEVSMRFNRPYARYFEGDAMLGISLEEFEAVLWGHIAIMARRIGLDFTYQVEGDTIHAALALARV